MSTICGHFVKNGTRPSTDIYDMLKKMEHRGPDCNGIYMDGTVKSAGKIDDLKDLLKNDSHVALGFSRLNITSNEVKTQPHISCDGRLALIINGEIYNRQELKTLLLRHHNILTDSDSEVVIHLIEESYQGNLSEAVKRVTGLLDGMYAIVVSDGKSVVVARDPIGKKPVYYVEHENIVYFASEKKALWNGKEDPVRLRPGELLLIDDVGIENRKGFELPMPQIDIVEFRTAVELYKSVLQKAMRKRLAGLRDTRLGVIFSGGIDSVLIANLLQREGRSVVCYCTGTESSGDVAAARSVAKELGLELKTAIINEAVVKDALPEIIMKVEENGLLQVEVAIPMFFAARMAAADNVRVMYTGQAADELYAGYPWYNDVLREAGYVRLHEKLWEDMGRLYDDTLEREDKLAMAHSIELRAPYLDRDVIQVAMRTSPRLKLAGIGDMLRKRVHRQAAVELGVPAHLAFRVKDPAQSGSGIHGIIENIATNENGRSFDNDLVDKNIKVDKGSLYRYGDGTYGEAVARHYIQQIHQDIQDKYVPGILN